MLFTSRGSPDLSLLILSSMSMEALPDPELGQATEDEPFIDPTSTTTAASPASPPAPVAEESESASLHPLTPQPPAIPPVRRPSACVSAGRLLVTAVLGLALGVFMGELVVFYSGMTPKHSAPPVTTAGSVSPDALPAAPVYNAMAYKEGEGGERKGAYAALAHDERGAAKTDVLPALTTAEASPIPLLRYHRLRQIPLHAASPSKRANLLTRRSHRSYHSWGIFTPSAHTERRFLCHFPAPDVRRMLGPPVTAVPLAHRRALPLSHGGKYHKSILIVPSLSSKILSIVANDAHQVSRCWSLNLWLQCRRIMILATSLLTGPNSPPHGRPERNTNTGEPIRSSQ
jgi:hypothetical protein